MQVVLGTTDISEYVEESSYKMNSEGSYESWEDGNGVEHRVYSRTKISGSFNVALYGKNDMDLASFMTLWNSVTSDHITTMQVYVANEGTMSRINAYCKITMSKHRKLTSGKYLDVLKIEVTER